MKIAIITPGGVDRSGTERVIPCLLWLIERLVKAGHEVHVFALQQEAKPARWTLLGAHIHNAGRRPRSLVALGQLLAENRRGRFDVIHAFWAQPGGAMGAVASRLLGVPMVLTLAGGDAVRFPDIRYGGRLAWPGRAMLRIACAGAAAVTAPSTHMVKQVAALGLSAQAIPLGVAADRWPRRAPRPRDPGAPLRLIHPASHNRVKDQPTLLRAMAILRASGLAFELLVIGEDTLAGEMPRLAAQLALNGQVHFAPVAPHDRLHAQVAASDILVMSSRHEAGPLVLLEAALLGVPTIGTAVGHIADYAPDAALAVPVGDAEALAEAIMRLADDEPLRLRLAAMAQVRALAEDADFTARSFLKIYASARNATIAPAGDAEQGAVGQPG